MNAHTDGRTRTTPQRLSLALAAVGAALMLAPAASQAAVKFGAEVTPEVQPSNANEPHQCIQDEPGQCTRISMEAYGRPDGGERAPKTGTIKKIRWIAGAPGSFKLQIADAKAEQEKARVTYTGEKIAYDGQPTGPEGEDPDAYVVEEAKVHAPVEKGQYLGIKSKETSMLRCSSGGPNQLLFQPALGVGGAFAPATHTDGCWLLLEAVIK
jgi:hypothetical protein